MKGGSFKGKDVAKFYKEYLRLDVTPLNMTFGVLYDSTVVALEKRKLAINKNEKDSARQDIRWREAVSAGEEILWEIMKELGLKETNAYRFSFRIMLLKDSTKFSEARKKKE